MIRLVVVENDKRWPLELEGADVVSARAYLTDRKYSELRRAAVFNLCRDFSYQSLGYYVSLLAAARGHRPFPSIGTVQDLGAGPAVRVLATDIDDLLQKQLSHLKSDRFELSVYFGHNTSPRYDRLCRILFNHFPAPLLRARFVREDKWRMTSLRAIGGRDVPEPHRPFVTRQAERFFATGRAGASRRRTLRYDLAILWREDDPEPPSDERAIGRFVRAARKLDVEAQIIAPDDYGRLAEFDALFIRETTGPNHYTYRFSRRALAEGLVVIDDPESILRCSNKVYQAELLSRNKIPTPDTLVVHAGNVDEVARAVGFPCVLKRPDLSFSLGVTKVGSEAELEAAFSEALEQSPLLIVQRWTPTPFDWRVGVLGRRALFACRYHSVKGHWQIAHGDPGRSRRYGKVEAVPLDQVPPAVLDAGVRAGSLVGDGLYGVDVKDVDGAALVIEVNDNPNIDSGNEDGVLGEELYLEIMRHFVRLIDGRGQTG